MLLYMWFRVWNQPEASEETESASDADAQVNGLQPIATESIFGDAVFTINPATGLTIDCSDAAIELFEASSRSQLMGIDLTQLFDQSWKVEERRKVKEGLEKNGRVSVPGIFRTAAKKIFAGELQAVRITSNDGSILNVRIIPLLHKEKIQSNASDPDWLEDALFPVALVGINYKIVKSNKAFSNLTGYTQDELRELTVIDLLHPDDRAAERKLISAIFRGEAGPLKKEKRMLRRNNEVIWVNTSLALSRDKAGFPKFIVTMTENVTQRKRIDRVMTDNRFKLNSLIENAEYGVVTIDRRHTIQIINSKLSDLLFVQTGVIVETGFNFLDILPEAFHKEYLDIHKRAFRGEEFTFDRTFTVNGRRSDVEIVVTPVQEENGFIRAISLSGHDVTERRKAAEELIRAREEAESATQAKSGFLATMSHEIRTPLNGVIGMGRLLSQTSLTPKQQEFVDSILLSGDALLSVINDILDFSKIESAKMELEYKPFALKRCIEETFDLMASKAIEKNLSLQYSIARDVPVYVYGDITRLRQILMNLVSNAIKFTQKGKISINVSRSKTLGDKIELRFDVRDTGIGIPQDKIARLFRSFQQADSSTAKTYGGTGLGLAICKNLVELMGGKISVESKVNAGSDFIFTILTEAVSPGDIPKNQRNGANRLKNSYVLIISDDKTEAALYADYFKRWGMIPQVAETVSGSVDAIRERKDYNLVMIDAQLIAEKPLVLAQEIRTFRSKDELPVVIFNALKIDDVFFDYTSELVSAVIPKNVDRSKVLDILISVFSVEEHQRSRDSDHIRGMKKKLADEFPAKILIAEDNLINQKLAQNIFEGIGYSPVIVSNGLQVIDQMRKQNFDIIFMDVQMPEMDGFETTRFIRLKLNPEKRPIIIAMTAFALEGDKEKCIEAGMDDYISKPFLIEEIAEKIRKWSEGKNIPTDKPSPEKQMNTATKQIINATALNRLKEMTGDVDITFLRKVLSMFIEQGEQQMEEIKAALAANQIQELGSQAHKLKGSALNIGAEELAETCRQMEMKGRENDGSGMKELVEKLIRDFESAKKALSEYLQ